MPKEEKLVEKITKLEVPFFNYDLIVVVTTSVGQSRANRNDKLGYYEINPHHGAMHCSNGGHESYIFLNFGADIGSIAHEVSHFVWRVMDWIGADHNNEVMAYLQGHYTREIALFVYNSSIKRKLPDHVKVLKQTPAKTRKKTARKKKLDN